jgi:hypothetical protein
MMRELSEGNMVEGRFINDKIEKDPVPSWWLTAKA